MYLFIYLFSSITNSTMPVSIYVSKYTCIQVVLTSDSNQPFCQYWKLRMFDIWIIMQMDVEKKLLDSQWNLEDAEVRKLESVLCLTNYWPMSAENLLRWSQKDPFNPLGLQFLPFWEAYLCCLRCLNGKNWIELNS